jgi:hypothetical protein
MEVGIAKREQAGVANLYLGGLQSAMRDALDNAIGGGGPQRCVGDKAGAIFGETIAGAIVIPRLSSPSFEARLPLYDPVAMWLN